MRLTSITRNRRAVCTAVVLAAGALVAPHAAAQVPFPAGRPLTGSISCRIETTGATTNGSYSETQTHTWTLTGAAPQVPNGALWIHPAQWSASGQGAYQWHVYGSITNVSRFDRWTISVTPRDAPIAIRSRASDGRLVVELWHSPSQAANALSGTITNWGAQQDSAPQPYSGESIAEAPLTAIEGDRTAASLTGSSSATLTGSFPTHGQGIATNVQVSETCTWSIAPAQSAAPLPPPPATGTLSSTTPSSGNILGRGGSPPSVTAPATPTNVLTKGSAADGPWSGQAQCVLTTTAPGYQERQAHTWRIISGPPKVTSGARWWPAVWTVEGGGRRAVVAAGSARAGSEETWTITVPETNAPITVWEPAGLGRRLRIGSQHAQLVARGAIVASPARPFAGSAYEWGFPYIEDSASNTTISGTHTKNVVSSYAWQPPSNAQTTETCTWNFTRGDVDQSSRNTTQTQPTTTAAIVNPVTPTVLLTPPPPPATPPTSTAAIASPVVPAVSLTPPPPPVTPPLNAPLIANAGNTATANSSIFAARSTGGGPTLTTRECATTGPAATASSITPGGVTLRWPQVTGASGYSVTRSDIGALTATSITALTYTHTAVLDYRNPPYQYSVTAYQSDGACATTTVSVAAPRPITPTVTPTITKGEQTSRVSLTWGDQADRPSGYLVLGPGLHENGAEIEASRSGQALNIDKVPAGDQTWLVVPFWRAGGGTISDISLAARVTATVGITAGRYQIFIAGFRVNNQTYDDPLNRDGWLDEIYAAAAVAKWESGALKTNEVAKSWVYGDANSSDRVRAGSGSGNGGLKAGDVVPAGWAPGGAQLPPETDAHRFPLKVWEGTLRDGEIVSVRPTLWEFDGDSGAYEYWRAWVLSAPTAGPGGPGLVVTKGPNSPLYQFINGAQYENESEAYDELWGSGKVIDFRRFDDGMKKTAARFFPGKDRIVGIDGFVQDKRDAFFQGDNAADYSRIHWVDRQVAFTREKIEAALQAAPSGGLAPGVIALSLVDEDRSPLGPLHGDYTLYLQVRRIP
jgi:hypothetical protein